MKDWKNISPQVVEHQDCFIGAFRDISIPIEYAFKPEKAKDAPRTIKWVVEILMGDQGFGGYDSNQTYFTPSKVEKWIKSFPSLKENGGKSKLIEEFDEVYLTYDKEEGKYIFEDELCYIRWVMNNDDFEKFKSALIKAIDNCRKGEEYDKG